ncbi:MAG: hypothetical protein AAGA85_21705, partial [Bacteroidota bacterium]
MKRKLVILTTHFGLNFSGGSKATCEVFGLLQSDFDEICVVGTQLGDHPFKSLDFREYRNWLHAVQIIRSLKSPEVLFYGDFFNSFLFILAGVPFHFTYHDNWPEARLL